MTVGPPRDVWLCFVWRSSTRRGSTPATSTRYDRAPASLRVPGPCRIWYCFGNALVFGGSVFLDDCGSAARRVTVLCLAKSHAAGFDSRHLHISLFHPYIRVADGLQMEAELFITLPFPNLLGVFLGA